MVVTANSFYVLRLASVYGNVDNYTPVAAFDTLAQLEAWEKSQRADAPYYAAPSKDAFGQKHGYRLVYKEGSSIQFYNPPDGYGWPNIERVLVEDANLSIPVNP